MNRENPHRSNDHVIIAALEIIANSLETEEGLYEGVLYEAANRIREYNNLLLNIKKTISDLFPEDLTN